MVGAGTTFVQSTAQAMSDTVTVAAKKRVRQHRAVQARAPMEEAIAPDAPHFGGTFVMGRNCWVDPDGRGVGGYWTACKEQPRVLRDEAGLLVRLFYVSGMHRGTPTVQSWRFG
jgi:hypothetical protein